MLKTADLNRSKKLKSLGWEQDGDFWWWTEKEIAPKWHLSERQTGSENCLAPTAGEMIEWLLGENLALIITKTTVSVGKEMDRLEMFLIKDGICNALADACAWVKERKE